MKKLLLLGGSRFLLPVIKIAHEMGIYVITCDYLPDNYAHQFSDAYHNISIVDKNAVLNMATKLHIDGIMSFATDPGVITAAYVAEKMGLPGNNPYESVKILQNKGRFRDFLKEHGFNVPDKYVYNDLLSALLDRNKFPYPVIVKPTDSAGSKGVMRVDDENFLEPALKTAFKNSLSNEVIVEQFIEKAGFSTDTDSFSINGELVFFSLNDQWFDDQAENVYTPAAYSWPSTMELRYQNELRNEVQRLLKLLNMGTSLYNIETRVGVDGKAYIMEVSPRGGGNRLSEMLNYACGQNLIKSAIQGALGEPIDKLEAPVYGNEWGIIILHSTNTGIFEQVEIKDEYKSYIIELDLWVKNGDYVCTFTGANEAIGTIIIRCDDAGSLQYMLENQNKWIKVKTVDVK